MVLACFFRFVHLRLSKKEERSVLNHLHLMAVEIFIFKELNRKDLLEWLGVHYSRMRGTYSRAWQIVNEEGYEAFIAELKDPKNLCELQLL